MQRRVALKNMALTMGALASLSSWASGWNKSGIRGGVLLAADQSEVLMAVVEGIIPKTDTPGAGELGVHKFVEKMVKDCYDKNVQDNFVSGISKIDTASTKAYGKPFAGITQSQKLELLGNLQKSNDADEKAFFGLVKNLTIQGYMNSEYVMTNITHYEMVPARYHGCVPVKK
ncbi:hypothetical protein DYBT9275_03613 [Dyadobacter sp. CECT 9275]|uniref:Gluconate 2-dehydrogenase subunit 3 family protein n=1 Tax=Dyadobacter helix TaxID=2822344 RepID=A0A916JF90_9BACT|nr:gluconate 2-dehydrogenase subunit 3 family protein [Dyadobacter sp. CECT 9275]CAG5005600.1 hypothetical protein DYBT9275_03613 [Dyadobacter sp. CECT 9275]